MKKVLLILPLLLLPFLGCHRRWGPEGRVDFVKDRISGKLDLTAEQKQKLDDLANTVKEQIKLVKEERRAHSHDDIKALIEAPTLDGERARALFDQRKVEISARADAIYAAVYPKFAAFHASLNDEQRKKAAEWMEKHHKRWNTDKD